MHSNKIKRKDICRSIAYEGLDFVQIFVFISRFDRSRSVYTSYIHYDAFVKIMTVIREICFIYFFHKHFPFKVNIQF